MDKREHESLQDLRTNPALPLYEILYRALRRDILKGVYKTGTRLTEEEIASQAGVSRTPVREALKRLSAEGFVEFTPKRGAIVIQLGTEEIRVIWKLRAYLTSIASEIAAQKANANQLRKLKTIIEEMEKASDKEDWIGFTEILMEFDSTIAEIADVRHLIRMLEWINPIVWELRYLIHNSHVRDKNPYSKHIEIYEAICKGDSDAARKLTESHLLLWGEIFINEYSRNVK